MDIAPYELDAGAMRRAREAVAEFNRLRPSAGVRSKAESGHYLIPFVAACAGLAIAVIAVPELYGVSVPLLAVVALGTFFGGRKLFGRLHPPLTEMQRATYDSIAPKLFSFIEGLRHEKGRTPDFFAGMPVKSLFEYDNVSHGDCLGGSHKGLEFEIGEAVFTRRDEHQDKPDTTHEVFSGVIAHSRIAVPFGGVLTVSGKSNGLEQFIANSLGLSGPPSIKSANHLIDETFDVKTNAWDGASERILRGGLGTTLLWLQGNWADGQPLIIIKGKDVYLLLPTRKPQFGVAQDREVLNFETDVAPIAERLVRILSALKMVRYAVETELQPSITRTEVRLT
jgi:hypothetical protein